MSERVGYDCSRVMMLDRRCLTEEGASTRALEVSGWQTKEFSAFSLLNASFHCYTQDK